MARGRLTLILFAPIALALGALAWLFLGDASREGGAGHEGRGENAAAASPEEAAGGDASSATLAKGSGVVKKPSPAEAPPPPPTFSKAEGVFGKVMDAKEKPIAGATVSLVVLDPQMWWNSRDDKPVATATTGADGEFLVGPAPADGRMKVKAEAKGYASDAKLVQSRGARVDLTLDRGGALRLRVKDETGAPAKGAEVRYLGGMLTVNAETGDTGEALLESLPTGQGTVRVTKQGYAGANLTDVSIEPGKTLERTCALAKGIAIAGRVTDDKGDRPVVGAEVFTRSQWDWTAPPSATATTGEDGRFTLASAGAPGEWVQVFAKKEGYVAGTTQTMLQASAGPGGQEVSIKMSKERAIGGRVDDPQGHPVAGATVLYANQWQRVPGASVGQDPVTTGADGRFSIGLPPGAVPDGQIFVAARAAGRGVGAVNATVPKPDAPALDLVIRLMGSGSVGGTVTAGAAGTAAGPDGKGLEGANVVLNVDWNQKQVQSVTGADATPMNWLSMQAVQDSRLASLSTSTDASGAWRITDVPAGTYTVSATWGLDRDQASEPVTIREGESETVNLTIGGGSTVEGKVVDSQSQPVAGARINAWNPNNRNGQNGWANGRSDSDGRFVLRGVTGTTPWQASVYATGYAMQNIQTLRPGDKEIEVRLATLGWISGAVVMDRGPYGQPFTVSVQATDAGRGLPAPSMRGLGNGMVMPGRPGGNTAQEFTSADGQFVLRGVAAGTYRVNVTTRDGWIPGSTVEVTVVDGRESGPVEIRLTRGASVTGTLVDDHREPVASAYVTLQVKGPPAGAGSTSATAQTDAKGRFSMQGLAAGTFTLAVRPPSGVSFDEEVRLDPAQALEKDLIVPRGGAIRVHVADGAGNPVAGANVGIQTANGTYVQPNWEALRREGRIDTSKPNWWDRIQQTDESGLNERTSVPPGRVQVTVRSKDGTLAPGVEWAEVAPDRTTELTVVLKPGGEAPPPK